VVLGVELMGHAAATRVERGRFEGWFLASPPESATPRLVLTRSGPVSIRVLDVSHGLKGRLSRTSRPPGVGIGGDCIADALVVGRTERLD
jgi:hypothetical protein